MVWGQPAHRDVAPPGQVAPQDQRSKDEKAIQHFQAASRRIVLPVYIEGGWPTWVIGARLGCHMQTICNRLKEFGIPARSSGPVPVLVLGKDVLSRWTPELAYKAVALGSWMYYAPDLPCLALARQVWANYAK